MQVDELPYMDEHAVEIEADAGRVWASLVQVDTAFSGWFARAYARAVGCADHRASGPRPLAEGSAFPGFHVETAVPRAQLVLAGHHRFSSYAVTLRIDELDAGRSRLRAETRADFPGVAGTIYRMLVIGTGGHAITVRRLLSGIKARAERRSRS